MFAVKAGAVAIPPLLVTAVAVANPANVPVAPVDGAVNVTVTPFTGLLLASLTVACKAIANTVLIAVLCGVPAVAVTFAAAPAMLVKLKLAGVATPATAAVMVYGPAALFAVKAGAVAIPLLSLTAVAVSNPPNVPEAPIEGTVKVTVTPFTGALPASLTVACKGVANAVPMVALCGVPEVAVTLAGGAAVFDKMKLAGAVTPATVAANVYGPV
jgi:hypothetical protein